MSDECHILRQPLALLNEWKLQVLQCSGLFVETLRTCHATFTQVEVADTRESSRDAGKLAQFAPAMCRRLGDIREIVQVVMIDSGFP